MMRIRAFAVLCLLAAPCAAGARLQPVGPAIPLPEANVLAVTPDGGYLVADGGLPPFPGDGGPVDLDVFVRRYDPNGASGPTRQVNLRTDGIQTPQRLVALAGGGYLVVWVTETLSSPAGAAARAPAAAPEPGEIAARLLDAGGIPTGPEILVNTPATFGWPEGAAALASGGFVATWHGSAGLFARRFDAQGEPLEPPILVRPRVIDVALLGGAVAPLPGGGFVVAFMELGGGVFARRYDGAGAPLGPALLLTSLPAAWEPFVAADGAGGFVAVWTHIDRPPVGTSYEQWVVARRAGPDGEPLGDVFLVDRPAQGNAIAVDVEMEASGRFLVAWNRTGLGPEDVDAEAVVGLFAPDGAPEGSPIALGSELPGAQMIDEVVRGGAGEWLAIWRRTSQGFGRFGQRLETACGGDADLCLHDERFRVEVAWELPGGEAGAGQAVPLTDDTGAFWFFGPDNLELMVKVLDGRALNGHFWVFFGALSDVEYTVTVTDTATGATRSYTNPAGTMASQADTTAF